MALSKYDHGFYTLYSPHPYYCRTYYSTCMASQFLFFHEYVVCVVFMYYLYYKYLLPHLVLVVPSTKYCNKCLSFCRVIYKQLY